MTYWQLCCRKPLNKLRNDNARYSFIEDLFEPVTAKVEHDVAGSGRIGELHQRIHRIFELLSPTHRDLLVKRYLEGVPQKVIAAMYGESDAWVCVQLKWARLAFCRLWLLHYPDDLPC